MNIPSKHQRLVLPTLALAAMLGAVSLAMWGLQNRAACFVTPSDIATGQVQPGKAMRLGGMVVPGSLARQRDGVAIRFIVGDTKARIAVRHLGIASDLFREGRGVIAEGRLADGSFMVDNILAKDDERYMPPQMAAQAAAR